MAQSNSTGNDSPVSSRKRRGVIRMVRHNLKVDMTPMVDLGFLLITFFVITAELNKPTVMDLYMPKDSNNPMWLGESNALTVMIDNGKMYYYNGNWKDAIKSGHIIETNLSGTNDLRKVIGDKQQALDIKVPIKEGRNGLMLLIKPGNGSSYKTVIDVLDEATISRVKKYAIVKLSEEERKWLEQK